MRNNWLKDEGQLGLLLAFATAAQSTSFAEAAEQLHITPSTLGRRIQKLERQLKTQLFVRTTRVVNITEAGAQYLASVNAALQQLANANAALENHRDEPSGELRASIPLTFGRICIAPHIPGFLARYPDIRLEIFQNDAFDDLLSKKIDVAIRIGRLEDSSLRARMLAPNIRRLVASPAYIERCGEPTHPSELSEHACLHFSHLLTGPRWTLQKGKISRTVDISPRLSSDDASSLFEATLGASGIALLADFITQEAIAAGKLITVLDDWQVPESGIYALYPHLGFLPKKSRVFIDYFADKISAQLATT